MSPSKRLHVCYALAMDRDPEFADQAIISAASVRKLYPNSTITILTDDDSLNFFANLRELCVLASDIRSVGRFPGSPRHRSRFIKTQARCVLDGDFLYLDADTVAVGEFGGLLDCDAPFSAAIDRNRVNPWGGFPPWVVPDYERLGWRYPTNLYLNAGIIFWKDCDAARVLSRLWHWNWLHYTITVDNPADQPAFNHSLDALGIEPKIMDDAFNARVGVSPVFAHGARIYHLLSGDERAEGTFLDELLNRYRESGQVDLSLIDDAAACGHPWPSDFAPAGRNLPGPG